MPKNTFAPWLRIFFGVHIFWTLQQPRWALGYHVGSNPNKNSNRPDRNAPPEPQQQRVGIFDSVQDGSRSNATKHTILVTPPRPVGNQQIPPMRNASRPRPVISTTASGPWIGTDQLNHLKETVNIIDVIEAHNLDRFERKGTNRATAICPFHDDHNPSLSIDSTRGIFKCFACGEGGDVFRFVSQMGRLQGEEMTFYDSVKRVQDEFADGPVSRSTNPSATATVVLTKEQAERRKRLQERMYQANAAAAAFYSEALVQPASGAARTYLRERHVKPASTRMFAIGYARDAYFGPSANRGTREEWGKGSLVEHLRRLDFTADELLAAGLAIQTKRAEQQQQQQQQQVQDSSVMSLQEVGDTSAQSKDANESVSPSFDVIMDRFRGRIVVPIFDSAGKRVLGFGARIIEEAQHSDFEQPKYLNSPESLVFQKKNILFGLHLAKEETPGESSKNVILVEGYMDAIALHSVGITGVVASMGTAVSSEQLLGAAQAAYRRGGSLILCLDSDDAGLNAMERLCTSGMISDILEKCSTDVRIATLPDGKKDPAEYVEAKLQRGSKKETVETDYKLVIVDKAMPWIDWYIQRILDSHSSTVNSGDEGSLRTIIDRLAEFISVCSSQIDRETKASEIANALSDLIARSGNATTVSDTVRNQLESDLLHLATNKGLAKEAAKRSGADYDEYSKMGSRKNLLRAALARGHGPTSSESRDKISSAKLNAITPDENELPATLRPLKVLRAEKSDRVKPRTESPRSSFKVKRRQSEPTMPDIIPHFSGFTFDSRADAKWLGVDRNGANLVLGLPGKDSRFIPKDELYPQSKKPVYFNSNEYLGKQIITDEAIKAGYSSDGITKDPSIAYKGVAFLVKPNAQKLHAAAEDELLTLLVRNGPARLSIKNWLDSRRAVHSEIDLHWTSLAKEWLFACLVDGMSSIPPGVIDPGKLHLHLAGRDDLPDGALSIVDNTTEILANIHTSNGSLDYLFAPSTSQGDPPDPKHGDMHAQELLATLMWASTAHFAELIKAKLDQTVVALEQFTLAEASTDESQKDAGEVPASPMANVDNGNRNNTLVLKSQLEAKCTELAQDFWRVQRSLQSLAESAKRVRHRVLKDNKAAWGVNRLSKSAQREFEEAMDEFVLGYSPPPAPPEVEALVDVGDPRDNEPYEDVLERLDADWGDWLDDESGSVSQPVDLPPILSDQFMDYDVDETLEEALTRLDEDWGDWAKED